MNRILKFATIWAKQWKIEFSVQKTKAVIFSRSRNKEPLRLFIDNSQIELVPEFRYLGIVFDKKLLWTSHIQQQCGKVISLLLKLKAVTKRNWGLPQRTNRFIYQRILEPILLYGCPVWASALDKIGTVTLLRRTQRMAALAITGALRTTSTDALLVLSGLKPIDLLARERCAIYFIKATQQRSLSSILHIQQHLTAHEGNISHDSSLQYIQRCAIELASYNLGNQLDSIAPIPPWEFPDDLVKISDEYSPPPFDPNSYNYYTDASQQGLGTPVGVAVVLQQNSTTFTNITQIKLPNYASVFQGELSAISEALQHAQDIQLEGTCIQVLSDSRSALDLLKQPDSVSPIARRIHQQIRDLQLRNKCAIKLHWVKAHNGIPGNEQADILAKLACLNGSNPSRPINSINTHFYKAKIHTKTDEIWNQSWSTSTKGRTTFNIFPHIIGSKEILTLTEQLNNHDRSLIFQAMSGHIPVNDYLFRFHLISYMNCQFCQAEKEDISHLLTTCSRYSLLRFMFLTPKNIHVKDMVLADYFKNWSLPLTLKILRHRFSDGKI
jgi:ribonuclease HI